jgi:uncharacterized SAM-binding protein YcdF (DUF218 family)
LRLPDAALVEATLAMEALFWLKQAVKALVLPPNGPLLLALLGLIVARRHPVAGRRMTWTGVVGLLVLSMPIVSAWIIAAMGRTPPPLDLTKIPDAQAIVILGGGIRPYAVEYSGATLSSITLERVRFGARVARATGLPVLVSGGALRDTPSEAALMRNALTSEYHVPVRWTEGRSRNTHENAVNSAAILKANGIARVILVGHRFDFPRSRREFEAAGIAVVAAPIGIPGDDSPSVDDFIPRVDGLQQSYFATYELLANIFYFVTK